MANNILSSCNAIELLHYTHMIVGNKDPLYKYYRGIKIVLDLIGPLNKPFVWNLAKQLMFESMFMSNIKHAIQNA